jgi:hypothetical protein
MASTRADAIEPDGVAVERILDGDASYLAVVTGGDSWLSPASTLQMTASVTRDSRCRGGAPLRAAPEWCDR